MAGVTPEPQIGVAARVFPGQSVNGDAWCVHRHGGRWRIALIDGAGHGPQAAHVAAAAVALLDANPEWSGQEAVTRCHLALKGTRGAVMTVAVLEPGFDKLVVTGAGNIEARLWTGDREQHLLTQRGMIGSNIPTIRPVEVELGPTRILSLHSDGVRARFSLREASVTAGGGAPEIASALLRDHARTDDDDATVLVVCFKGAAP